MDWKYVLVEREGPLTVVTINRRPPNGRMTEWKGR